MWRRIVCTRPPSTFPGVRARSPIMLSSSEACAATAVSLSDALTREDLLGRRIQVHGWVKGMRRHKDAIFVDLDDGLRCGQRLQLVVEKHVEECQDEGQSDFAAGLDFHASVRAEGTLQESSHPQQKVELACDHVHVFNAVACADTYPFRPRMTFSAKHARKFPMCSAKLNGYAALLRTRNSLSQAVHDFFQKDGFIQIQTPILTSNDCEGAGEVFEVIGKRSDDCARKEVTGHDVSCDEAEDDTKRGDYFGRKVFLTVSGQLHLEAICNGIAKVYNFSPVFRAEKGRSKRHLCEFTMIEAEQAFITEVIPLMRLTERFVKEVIHSVWHRNWGDIEQFSKMTKSVVDSKTVERALTCTGFPVVTYDEAVRILNQHDQHLEAKAEYGSKLSKEHELFLTENYFEGVPVFISNWPCTMRPFYAKPTPDDDRFSDSFDLLFPRVGELVGGSLRQYSFQPLQESVTQAGVNVDALEWYVNMRRCGSAPTGGFGLGYERLVQFLLQVSNIRDTLPFPRTPNSCLL